MSYAADIHETQRHIYSISDSTGTSYGTGNRRCAALLMFDGGLNLPRVSGSVDQDIRGNPWLFEEFY